MQHHSKNARRAAKKNPKPTYTRKERGVKCQSSPPRRYGVANARFITSASSIKNAKEISTTEIAILGRSNVGKSSFINMLLDAKLAKSSQTPGKTRLVNFYAADFIRIEEEGYGVLSKADKTCSVERKVDRTNQAQPLLSKTDRTKTIERKTDRTKSLERETPIAPSLPNSIAIEILDFPGFGYAKVSKGLKREWDSMLHDFLQRRSSIKLYVHLVDSRHLALPIDEKIARYLEDIARGDAMVLRIYTKADKLTKSELHRLKTLEPNSFFSSTNKKSFGIMELTSLRGVLIDSMLGTT